ncbi:MAG: hypothetical protein Q9226_008929, partial [Calogaya cf. arnoldii]
MLRLPQKIKRQNPDADPTAYQKVGPLPNKQTYLKFKRIVYDGGDLANDKNNAEIQQHVNNLMLDAQGYVYRQGRYSVTGPFEDRPIGKWTPGTPKTLDPVFVKC